MPHDAIAAAGCDDVIWEQVEFLLRHVAHGTHGPECRECARYEALRLVTLLPFETRLYQQPTAAAYASASTSHH